jgi:hypothetical protein
MSLTVQASHKPTSTEDSRHTTIEIFIPMQYHKEQVVFVYTDDDHLEEPSEAVRVVITNNFLLKKRSQSHQIFTLPKKDLPEPSPTIVLGLTPSPHRFHHNT